MNWALSKFVNAIICRRVVVESQRFFASTSRAPDQKKFPDGQPPWKVLFFGTDQYSVFALETILKRIDEEDSSLIQKLGVCSRFTKPACELAKYHKRMLNEDFVPSLDYDPESDLKGWDVGIVASFGHLIPPEVISSFPYGILCIHPSLLPRWRGASPLMQTILNGDAFSGVSIMRIMPSKFDVGPIVRQEKVTLLEKMTSRQLGEDLMTRGGNLLMEVLEDLPRSLEVAVPQTSDGVTYAKKIPTLKTFIDWSWSAEKIDRFQRALLEDFGIRTYWEDSILKLTGFLDPDLVKSLQIEQLCPQTNQSHCGELYFHKKRNFLFVRCGDGWVGLRSLVVPERGPMTVKEFYNGFLSPDKNGQTFFQTTTAGDASSKWKSQMKLDG